MWSSKTGLRRRQVLCLPLLALPAALPAVLSLSGCGFQLRQAPRLRFASIALAGFAPQSQLAEELRQQLALQVRTVAAGEAADVVLQAVQDLRERSAVASTSAAEVRELQLSVKFKFRARSGTGRELIPLTELAAGRSMSYRETAALAKEFEERELYREMQSDVVAQVLRRLAAVAL